MTNYTQLLYLELEEAYGLWLWYYQEETPKLGATKNNSDLEGARKDFIAKFRRYQAFLKDEGLFTPI